METGSFSMLGVGGVLSITRCESGGRAGLRDRADAAVEEEEGGCGRGGTGLEVGGGSGGG